MFSLNPKRIPNFHDFFHQHIFLMKKVNMKLVNYTLFGLIVNCFLNSVSERNIYVSLNGHLECLVSIGHWGKMNTCLSNIEKKGRQRRKNPNRIELFHSIWKNLNWKRWVGKRCQTDCTEPYILENSTKGLLMLFGCSECLCMTTHECH